jgi:hypothetical protein
VGSCGVGEIRSFTREANSPKIVLEAASSQEFQAKVRNEDHPGSHLLQVREKADERHKGVAPG